MGKADKEMGLVWVKEISLSINFLHRLCKFFGFLVRVVDSHIDFEGMNT